MTLIDVIAAVVVIVGALNWGLVAVARFDLVRGAVRPFLWRGLRADRRRLRAVGVAGVCQASFWNLQGRWMHPATHHA